MAFQNITLEKKEKIGWITINRPEALNVLGMATLLELESALDEIEKDEKVWVGVLTGAGEKAFCAGADLKEMGVGSEDYEKVNVNGSGISLGHPIACTGTRVLVTLLHEMRRRNARYGLESICGGGGLGIAAIFERR